MVGSLALESLDGAKEEYAPVTLQSHFCYSQATGWLFFSTAELHQLKGRIFKSTRGEFYKHTSVFEEIM